MSVWRSLHELVASYPARKVVTVAGTVAENNPDQQDNDGARHQILIIRIDAVRSAGRGPAPAPGDLVYVAIRYGDQSGLKQPIPNVTPGSPIAVRGAYIPPEAARLQRAGERLGVLHFTHRPVGWVEYGDRRYD